MNNVKTGAAAIAAIVFGLGATAQAAIEQGDWELSFSGSYSALDVGDVDLDLLLLDVEAGYFVTNALSVSGKLGYLDADVDDLGMDATLLGLGVDYHFSSPESSFVTYVGAGVNYVHADVEGFDEDDLSWEIRAGLKQFVAENVAIKYEVSYLEFDDLDLDGWNFGVGLAVFF